MALITSDDVTNRFRSDVDDPLRGPVDTPDADALWKIDEVNDYLADAVEYVARKTLVQFQTFELPVTANQPLVPLQGSTTVLDIEHAYLQGANRYLQPRNTDGGFSYHDDYNSPFILFSTKWEQQTGSPRFYLRDYKPGNLRLVPIPVANDTLTLTASTIPAFAPGSPLPFTTREDKHLVVLWMKKLAYAKHDSDTYDSKRSEQFESEFYRLAEDRKYEAKRMRRSVQPAQFSW